MKRLLDSRNNLKSFRFSKADLLTFILVFGAIGGYLLLKGHAAGPAANLWIDGGTGSCTRSAIPAAYSASTACANFSAAYQAAQPGDFVFVNCAGGTSCSYPNQSIYYPVSKTGVSGHCREAATFQDGSNVSQDYSACITIQQAPGVAVTIGNSTSNSIVIEVPYVRLIGFSMPLPADKTTSSSIAIGANAGRVNVACSAWNVHDVIVDGLTSSTFTVHSSSYVYIENSDFGPLWVGVIGNFYTPGASQVSGCNNLGSVTSQDHLVLDNIFLHDYHMLPDIGPFGGVHMEGIHWNQGDFGVIKNSLFENIGQQDISFENASSTAGLNSINNTLVENNYFDKACSNPAPGDGCGVISGGTTTFICHLAGASINNESVLYNSYDAGGSPAFFKDDPSCSMSNVNVQANIVAGPVNSFSCTSSQSVGVNYTYNVFFNSQACGTGNSLGNSAAAIYTSPSYPDWDYSLQAGSVPINFVPLGQPCPADDIVGTSRPQGASCDAGADEFVLGASTKPGDLNNDGQVDITDLSIQLSHYGQSGQTLSTGDCDGDGSVTIADLSILLSHYGT